MILKWNIFFFMMVWSLSHDALGMKRIVSCVMPQNKGMRTFCDLRKGDNTHAGMHSLAQDLNKVVNPHYPFIQIEHIIFYRIQNNNTVYGVYTAQEILLLQKYLDAIPNNRAWSIFLKQKAEAEIRFFKQSCLECVDSLYVDQYVKHVHNLYGKIIPKLFENKELSDLFWNNLALNKKRWVNDAQLASLNSAEKRYFETRNALQMGELRRAGFDLCSLKPL